MARRVLLHIGLPKSGTSYLQGVILRNRQALREMGLLFPGNHWGRQVDAVRDLRGLSVPPERRRDVNGAWNRLVSEMQPWPGDALVSMEWLCMAAPRQVERVARDLADTEVHVVLTVRDLARTIPAAWQEFTQNRATWTWEEFLGDITSAEAMETEAGRLFWRQQDVELILDRWSVLAPAERTHVVSVPQGGGDPTELWRRFAAALDLSPTGVDASHLGANESLGLESAELMRRINERLDGLDDVTLQTYNRVFKHQLGKKILTRRRPEESHVVLPTEYHEWVRNQAERHVAAIRTSGTRVHGSLEDLQPRLAAGVATAREQRPTTEALLEAALEGLSGFGLVLDQQMLGLNTVRRETEEELRRLRAEVAALRSDLDRRVARPFRQALIDVSQRRPALRVARAGYWRAVNARRRLSGTGH